MGIHLVTGAASGIGAAVARRLAGPEAHLVLHTGHNRAGLAAVAQDCRDRGATVEEVVGDLAEAGTVEAIAARGLGHSRLDSLVFAAGYAKRGSYREVDLAELDAAYRAMPRAFLQLSRDLTDRLAAARGRIVAVSAFGAHAYSRAGHAYAATAPAKATLESLVRALAAELAPAGVTVNCVVPGYVAKDPGTKSSLTPEQWAAIAAAVPMGRLVTPDEVAAAIAFFLSPPAAMVTGQSLRVDGGLLL